MNPQFKRGILEMCTLQIISKQDMYGFEVIEYLADILKVNENTIYPLLRRLTNQKLFTTYEKESTLGAPRKYYQITESGKEQLASYLLEWEQLLQGVNFILGGDKDE